MASSKASSTAPIEDSALLAGIFQAAATVVAVLVGYGLSVLAERKAWQRRKEEQLRERRLQSLIDFIDRVSKALDWAEAKAGQAGVVASRAGGPSAPAAREALMSGVRSTLQAMHEEARSFSGDIGRRYTELRLLRVGADALSFAERCVEGVDKLRDVIGGNVEGPSDVARIEEQVGGLRRQIGDNLASLTSRAADNIGG